jgi:hypothetical protein
LAAFFAGFFAAFLAGAFFAAAFAISVSPCVSVEFTHESLVRKKALLFFKPNVDWQFENSGEYVCCCRPSVAINPHFQPVDDYRFIRRVSTSPHLARICGSSAAATSVMHGPQIDPASSSDDHRRRLPAVRAATTIVRTYAGISGGKSFR